MKIALPSDYGQVDQHFGHCRYFTVFTINENNEIINEEIIQSPEGCGCKSNIASVLADMDVEVMLAGNMGEGAVNNMNIYNIAVVRGCSGDTKEVALDWLNGNITDNGETCHTHEHHHGENCGQ